MAYAVDMPLNNLFEKSKEPFWQQAWCAAITSSEASPRPWLHAPARGSVDSRGVDDLARPRPRHLDADAVFERSVILRATTQELGPTREAVLEAVVQRLDVSQKHAAEAYTLAEQYEANPRAVWGYVQGLTRLSQRTPWQYGRFGIDRAASRLLATVN